MQRPPRTCVGSACGASVNDPWHVPSTGDGAWPLSTTFHPLFGGDVL
jgi:hypothetical protein